MAIVLAKVYAAFSTADKDCFSAVAEAGQDAMGHEEDWLFLEGDMVRISWEGLYFPVDEVLEALGNSLPPEAEGKLDYLDLEAWTLTRFVFTPKTGSGEKAFSSSTRNLNQVLEYSGH